MLIARSNASFRVVRWIARRGVLRPRDNVLDNVHVPWGGRDRVAGSSSGGGSSNPWSQLPVPRAGRKGHAVTGGSAVGLSCWAPAAAGSEVHADANHPEGVAGSESHREERHASSHVSLPHRGRKGHVSTRGATDRLPAYTHAASSCAGRASWGAVVGSGRVGGRRCLTLVAVPTRAGRKGPHGTREEWSGAGCVEVAVRCQNKQAT